MNRKSPAPSTCRVADLRRGDKISGAVFLVEAANFKQTRNQKYFIQMRLRDSSAAVKAIRWEATQQLYSSFGVGDFLRIDGRVEEFQGQLQVIIDQIEPVSADEVEISGYLPTAERDPEEMERELLHAVEEVEDPSLRQLLAAVLEDPRVRSGLLRCPAGKALHHAYVGGLLEHIVSLLEVTRFLAKHYQQLDRDLLYAACILHDIGKVEELTYTSSFQYTDRGQLIGHIGLGMLLIEEKAREIPELPEETLLHVQHIIASHHGLPEHGALKLPMTAEAIMFHLIDNLDAKLATLKAIDSELGPEEAGRDSSAGKWSEFKPYLNRKIFFPPKKD
ncbi:MAG: HD domain-containing protein [Planctomycetota bacterium]|nr:HD domain-containing protein [Planctomycetota bacterium]